MEKAMKLCNYVFHEMRTHFNLLTYFEIIFFRLKLI